MKSDPNIEVLQMWAELRSLFNERDNDAFQNSMGNIAAGVRLRQTLRHMKKMIPQMLRLSNSIDSARRRSRRLVNKQKKSAT